MLEPKTGPELIDVKAAGPVYSGGGKKKKLCPSFSYRIGIRKIVAASVVFNEIENIFVQILAARFILLGLRPLLPNYIPVSGSGLCSLSFSSCAAVGPED